MLLFYIKKSDISYRLATITSVYNENSTVDVYLDTVGVPDDTVLDYIISGTGIAPTDFTPSTLVGAFTIRSNTASTTFTIATDQMTEGTETAVLRLANGRAQVSFSIIDTSKTPLYLISANAVTTNEGGTIVYTLTTENVVDGTLVDYNITGTVTTQDYTGLPTGSFVVYNNTATLNVPIIADELTEGTEAITLSLVNGHSSVTVTILDTSKTRTLNLTASKTSADEGTSVTITLSTENVPDGAIVPYTITGISSTDISVPLTGNFTIAGGASSVIIGVLADIILEGTETLTLTLDESQQNVDITLNDTSFPISYVLSASTTTIDEGLTISYSLVTEGVPTNTLVPYTISGVTSDDISGLPLMGNFTIVGNFAGVNIPISADFETEGVESITLALQNGLATSTVQISDTSKTQTFSIGTSTGIINEGGSVTFSLSTENVPNGTTIPYTIAGVNPADIDNHTLSGVFTVVNNISSETFTITKDYVTDGDQTFSLTLDNGKASASVYVVDTSKTQGFLLNPSATLVDEGTSVTFTLTTQNVDDDTLIGYTITGISIGDISNLLTGNFSITANTAQVTLNVTADQLTEGSETLSLTLDNMRASASVSVTDISLSKTYTLVATPTLVSEGSTISITLTTENVVDGTCVDYILTGITNADITGSTTGSFIINNNTSTVLIDTIADHFTEGTETGVLTLSGNLGSVSFQLDDTSKTPTYSLSRSVTNVNEGDQFTINLLTTNVADTTVLPYTITGVASADIGNASLTGNFVVVNNAASLVLTTTADQLTEGAETFAITLDNLSTTTSVTINDTSKTRTYSLSSDVGTVYEGSSVTVTLTTTNVPDNTLIPYTISGTGITTTDISGAALTGNFIVVGNTASATLNIAQDGLTESVELLQLTLDGGLGAVSVTVDDMSPMSEFYGKTALYLKGDGINNGGNTTIKDSSINNLTVTKYTTTTTQGTVSPFSHPIGYWGGFFYNGISTALVSSANYGLATGDFTIECWVTTYNTTTGRTLVDFRASGSAASQNKVVLKFTADGTLSYFINGAARISTTAVSTDSWHHIALCRSSGTTKLYVDGIQRGVSYSDAGTKGTVSDVSIGQDGITRVGQSGGCWYGSISNLRIIKYAVYTTNFTPSTNPLTTTVNGVTASILMLNNRYLQTSNDITAVGTQSGAHNWGPVMTSECPFPQPSLDPVVNTNSGSLCFMGTTDYLKIANSTTLEPGAGDFTLEMVIKITGENWNEYCVYTKRANASTCMSIVLAIGPNNLPKFYGCLTAGTWDIRLSSVICCYIGSWSHIAITRSGTTWSLWVNGMLGATTQATGTVLSSTAMASVLSDSAAAVAGYMVPCYMTGVRFVKGTSLYNTPFTPPSSMLTAVTGTSLLLNGMNGSVYDSVAKNAVTLYGTTKISTTQSKSGGSSIYFGGNGNYLTAPDNASLNISGGDFSIDVWVYMTAAPTSVDGAFIFSKDGIASTTNPQYRIGILPTKQLWFQMYSNHIPSFYTLVLNTWTHIAIARINGTVTTYINGTSTATATFPNTPTPPTGRPLYVGWEDSQLAGSYFTGHMENFRIIKGTSIFTTNFDPATTLTY